jgi:hypothetical protein
MLVEENKLNWNSEESSKGRKEFNRFGRLSGLAIIIIVLIGVIYYTIGMAVVHKVDDNVDFKFSGTKAGGSYAVSLSAALIDREVNINSWVANDPFFMPGYLLDNMPNYQQGIIYAVSRFVMEMTDQIGRSRGSSEVDKDLDKASGLLKYPGTTWIFDFSTSIAPTASSESQYRSARRSLLAYNERLAKGDAMFERRADNLQATLMRFTADLGSNSAVIDDHLAKAGHWGFDTKVDDVFYSAKGRLYAYYLILRGLGKDFESVNSNKELTSSWALMLESLRQAASLDPLVVVNGKPDGAIAPSHLASLGFYLLRARTQLREIINILQK